MLAKKVPSLYRRRALVFIPSDEGQGKGSAQRISRMLLRRTLETAENPLYCQMPFVGKIWGTDGNCVQNGHDIRDMHIVQVACFERFVGGPATWSRMAGALSRFAL
jgi:hypothetical protein